MKNNKQSNLQEMGDSSNRQSFNFIF